VGGATFARDKGWNYLPTFHPDWRGGGGEWAPAWAHPITWPPASVHFAAPNPRTRGWFRMLAGLAALTTAGLALLAWVLGKVLLLTRWADPGREYRCACWLLVPALFGGVLEELLRFRL